jgi:carbamoylphosphate synthase large subunit
MNKYASLRTMKRAGVNVPKFWSKSEMIRLLRGRDKIVFPVVARKAEHNNGSGLWVCLTKLDVRIALRKGAHHFLEFVHVHKSYRVYVYKNSVVEIIEKVPSLDATLIDLVSRNDDDGWDWNVVPPFSPLTSRVGSQALKAARSLGLDLCAIDIALDDAGRSFVFEINSASWMTQETANKYARFINEDFAED